VSEYRQKSTSAVNNEKTSLFVKTDKRKNLGKAVEIQVFEV